METLTENDILATNGIVKYITEFGVKPMEVISIKKMKSWGFKPAVEINGAAYWHKSDLESAARNYVENMKENIEQKDTSGNDSKPPSITFEVKKITYRLEQIEKKLDKIIYDLSTRSYI